MDTSERYIKMCVKAEEIQKLDKDEDNNFYEYSPYPNCHGHHMPVWLPRQDQLQEMVVKEEEVPNKLSYRFALWTLFSGNKFTSMEQLWLAFVMKEKFNKIWGGEKWTLL